MRAGVVKAHFANARRYCEALQGRGILAKDSNRARSQDVIALSALRSPSAANSAATGEAGEGTAKEVARGLVGRLVSGIPIAERLPL
jgi:hypothetical protein